MHHSATPEEYISKRLTESCNREFCAPEIAERYGHYNENNFE